MNPNTFPNVLRATLATLVSTLILAASPAAAQSVGDLSCNGCVDKDDLARGAISTPKLKKGAVKWNKLGKDVQQRFDDMTAHLEYVSVAGATVRPSRPDAVVRLTTLGGVASAQVDDTFMFGAVQLPHLTTVDSMSCVVEDRDDTAYIQISLLRSPVGELDGGLGFQIVASSGTFRPSLGEDPVALDMRVQSDHAVVDNRLYHYYFRVDMLDVPQPPNDRLMFHGCTIRMARDSL